MRIKVVRGNGEFPGIDISDPLITDIRVALERGRFELNEGEDLQQVELETLYASGIKRGQLIENYDDHLGVFWRGIVIGISHTSNSRTRLTIKRLNPFK